MNRLLAANISLALTIGVLLCGCTLTAVAQNPAPAVQDRAARRRASSITGLVVDDSGRPLANAGIYVNKVGVAGSQRTTSTDDKGRFRVDDLPAGAYSVTASAASMVPADEPIQRRYYRPGDSVTLRLMKGGVITGKVTNSAGEPLIAARVQAIRLRTLDGRPLRTGPGRERQADDRGIYRLYGLYPGVYHVVVNAKAGSSSTASPFEDEAPTYHPSATRDTAAEVIVRAGDEVINIDIRYRSERGHAVSGTYSSPAALGSSSVPVTITLARAPGGAIEASTFIPAQGNERSFAIYGVPDGEYELTARVNTADGEGAASAPRRIAIRGADVTGVELALAPLASILGRVELAASPETQLKPDCRSTRSTPISEIVVVARADESPDPRAVASTPERPVAPDEKGEFKVASLTSGRYHIEAQLPVKEWYVRSMTLPAASPKVQPRDAARNPITAGSGERVSGLTITISEGAASLSGRVIPTAEGASLPDRLRVLLVPADAARKDDALRFSETVVERDGAFELNNLAPGRYKVVARVPPVDDRDAARPFWWDATGRGAAHRDADAAGIAISLGPCEHLSDYPLPFSVSAGKR
ncbi:MAG TPA: carboxypeptidase-like regulatory domain-containing protein [Blastocatellia bacterium]|nr:carboxypeptidase-like regulatory domain-containing protein [Blastocatellia bacterium]